MKLTRLDLRRFAVTSSLFPATTLVRAMGRLGFVQADPIQAPARAQDLILRQRVRDYRAGDLDRSFRRLGLEEDFLYAYGFMPRTTWQMLHPRPAGLLTPTEVRVLDAVRASKRSLHPRDLEAQMGADRERNAWGGYSKATTRALERLHYLGPIRVAGREGGTRVYERIEGPGETAEGVSGRLGVHEGATDDGERLRALVLVIAKILAPVAARSLQHTLRLLGRAAPTLARRGAVAKMLATGDLEGADVEGVRYVWPRGRVRLQEPGDVVRFLAPFDPVVWERRRFEHLWGWSYRFEAYTPAAKRKLGYYALPLLWRADVIGWVNVLRRGEEIDVVPGFVAGRAPRVRGFGDAFAEEEARLRMFLEGRAEPVR